MTPEQLQILQHALGVDEYGQSPKGAHLAYDGFCRNWFGAGASDEPVCRELIALGFMEQRKSTQVFPYFNCAVTKAGIAAMREASPKPPKLTRAQLRMEEYRNFSDAYDCTFREFLSIQKTDWYREMKGASTR